MYTLDLNRTRGVQDLTKLINLWSNNSRVESQPLVIVKISDAFSMYHQVSRRDFRLKCPEFNGLHPILINDLDTNGSVVITMDTDGQIIHYYLINNQGRLIRQDSLGHVAHKNANQEYLDYFYCITKNAENYLDATAGLNDK